MRSTRRAFIALCAATLTATAGGTADASLKRSTPTTTADDETGSTEPSGVVTYASFYEPSRLDPHRASNAGDAEVLFLTYDRLIHLSPEADPVPGLAESWSYSDDGLELTLNLRSGITFHDDTPFDAEAVRANLERAMTVEGSIATADLAAITEIEVVSPTVVTLHLDHPQASLLAMLSDRHGAMISPAAFENPDLDQAPVGAGMYRVVEYRPGEVVIFEPYENYWDTSVSRVARLEYRFIGDETTRLNALKAGDIDVALILPSQVQEATESGLLTDMRTTLVYEQMFMNLTVAPFDNVDVRRALNYAIDRQAMVDSTQDGLGEPNSQIFPEGYWAFNEELGADYYTYDPDKARELLAEAGFSDGFSFEVLLPTPGNTQVLAEVLQGQLAAVGIDMTINRVPVQNAADIFLVQQQGSSMLGAWSGRQDPSMTTTLRWTSTGFANPGRYALAEMEDLNAQALATNDQSERTAIFAQMDAIALENALDLVFYNTYIVHGANERITEMPTIGLNGKVEFRHLAVTD
ncbi:MAG: ABC transporter substrate-binding protein [Desertimonas sp.]